ncbi:MAG: hypothetical protein M0Z46_10895 [Actinomycetota bacterium]|jgi:hypothetical protein|nr:hypothetical protein [Actinomycetota bacterium]
MHFGRKAAAAVAVGAMAGALSVAAPAFAAYGAGSVHQIAIAANLPPNLFGPGTGGGIWLWIQLTGNGAGTYEGADCLHHGTAITPTHPTGAGHDAGTVTWSLTGTTVVITGVHIGPTAVTITVSNNDGHYMLGVTTVFSGLGTVPGSANVQVAP